MASIKSMRDEFLLSLHKEMLDNENIFFVTADFGSPMLDKMRVDFPERCINVGIAEQNLINISTGLALEGYTVFAYAIAPFITMRCYEQIRINIAMLSQIRPMNINLIGVGAGVSYSMSGPTHHCLEDLSIMKTLPNIDVFSPSDYVLAQEYLPMMLSKTSASYCRFDAQPMEELASQINNIQQGFRILKKGHQLAIIATGFMTHKAMMLASAFDISVIDLYLLNCYDKNLLTKELEEFDTIITLEEGFINAGGLDSEINTHFKNKEVINLGFDKHYDFGIGDREFIHAKNRLSLDDIKSLILKF